MEDQKLSRENKIELYDKLVKANPGATLKGDTIPYTLYLLEREYV